jgi:diguanylate cyclase (GGDEF)-like protein
MSILQSQRSSWLERALDACRSHPKSAFASSLAVSTLIAVADLITGDRFPMIVCYVPCVMIICWVSHVVTAVIMSMVCCTIWLVDDVILLEEGGLTASECWNAVAHLAFFLMIIGMLVRLRVAQERERRLARTDGLTGLMNTKAFRETAERELARSTRDGTALSIAFIDCDNFKTVNDTLGHLEGDQLLQAVAQVMDRSVRTMDVPCRMGGDEFAILLPGAAQKDAEQVIERLRTNLQARMDESAWPVTFSMGVAVYETLPESVDSLIQGADVLMYEVKQQTKDAVAYKLVA